MRSTDARLAALAAAIICTTAPAHGAWAAPAAAPATSTVTLQWTAPGDDGQIGLASRYELRYATEPITRANWNDATIVNEVPHPQQAGKREKVKVRGLSAGTQYWFAVRSVDEAGNWSQLSNVAYRTAPDPALAPAQFTTSLSSPWPCPTRGPVRLELTLSSAIDVDVEVFDIGGRRIKTLALGDYPAGTSLIGWDSTDEQHRPLPIGTYFVIGRLGTHMFYRRMTVVP